MILFPASTHQQQGPYEVVLLISTVDWSLSRALWGSQAGWRWMEIRSRGGGWRRVQETDAKRGNSSKWQNRGGIYGSWKQPKQGMRERERCPSISAQISPLPPIASCRPSPAPSWVSDSISTPAVCCFLYQVPHLGLKVLTSPLIPPYLFTFCSSENTASAKPLWYLEEPNWIPTLFVSLFCSVTLHTSLSFSGPHFSHLLN